MLDPGFRAAAFHEARKCLRCVDELVEADPDGWDSHSEVWANLLGAIANAVIASVPDSVASVLVQESQKVVHEHIRGKLKEK